MLLHFVMCRVADDESDITKSMENVSLHSALQGGEWWQWLSYWWPAVCVLWSVDECQLISWMIILKRNRINNFISGLLYHCLLSYRFVFIRLFFIQLSSWSAWKISTDSKAICIIVWNSRCQSLSIAFWTRGQSNLTKSASRGARPIPRLVVTAGGRKLYHWIPGVGFPISVL